MRPPYSDKELSSILKTGAKLIVDCAQGRISFEVFLAEYDSFYMKYELDGHESVDAELALFQQHAAEVSLHKAVWSEILTKITADEFIVHPEAVRSGFIDHTEGFVRLKKIADKYSSLLLD